jgi:Na+-transporting NADH:ubiquinone oxidoreductase subunit NqrC
MKKFAAFIIALAICCTIIVSYYNYLLSNSRHMQDIRRFDKIEEILRKGGNYPLSHKKNFLFTKIDYKLTL